MTLLRVQVSDFRCVQSASLELDSKFTLIRGENASGKTTVLEAIYALGRGRSFRTPRLQALIRSGATRFVVFGQVDSSVGLAAIGIEGSSEGTQARAAGDSLRSLAELAALHPVQVIDPEVHRLIEEGPGQRRRFLDWGVFHVEHTFIGHWRRYQQTLKQRNAGLRSNLDRLQVRAWDGELLRLGLLIDAARRRYIEKLALVAADIVRALLGHQLGLEYRSGWPKDVTFESGLERSWLRDLESGTTTVGPHRADMMILLDGVAVKDRISRGQQKLLAAALVLAQIRCFPAEGSRYPTLLLDDPAAELDKQHLTLLIQEIVIQPVQIVVTSLHAALGAFGNPGRQYLLTHGTVQED